MFSRGGTGAEDSDTGFQMLDVKCLVSCVLCLVSCVLCLVSCKNAAAIEGPAVKSKTDGDSNLDAQSLFLADFPV